MSDNLAYVGEKTYMSLYVLKSIIIDFHATFNSIALESKPRWLLQSYLIWTFSNFNEFDGILNDRKVNVDCQQTYRTQLTVYYE